jgi:hypothetical protein
MNPHISGITLGVKDVNRAKQFYSKGLGWPIQQEQGEWVSFSLNNGSSALGLLPRDMLAGDAGVPADGSGFRGITFSYIVPSEERVDAVLAEAERAGGKIARPAQGAAWGGYFGYFTDPDGYLWKVVVGAEEQPSAAE